MADAHRHSAPDRFGRVIGRTRYVVVLAVAAVLLVAFSLFLLGTVQACAGVYRAWAAVLHGELRGGDLTVEFLEIVSVMLKAVVFYIIGVGLYSLFVAPLNVAVSLGVETLYDLETKVVSVVIVILAVTFLEHFIRWQEPLPTLQFGAALGVTVAALVLFQFHSARAKREQKERDPDTQARARRELFERDNERQDVRADEVSAGGRD